MVASGICLDGAGVPWIEGTTTKAIEVVLNKESTGATPEDLRSETPHLSLAQIDAALAYYLAHKAELDADIHRRFEWTEQMRLQEKDPLTRAQLLVRRKAHGWSVCIVSIIQAEVDEEVQDWPRLRPWARSAIRAASEGSRSAPLIRSWRYW